MDWHTDMLILSVLKCHTCLTALGSDQILFHKTLRSLSFILHVHLAAVIWEAESSEYYAIYYTIVS